MSNSYPVRKITDKDTLRLRVKGRRKIPYDEALRIIMEGYTAFIPDLNRKMASYVKRQLEERAGTPIFMEPSDYVTEKGPENGYIFKVALVERYLEEKASRGRG